MRILLPAALVALIVSVELIAQGPLLAPHLLNRKSSGRRKPPRRQIGPPNRPQKSCRNCSQSTRGRRSGPRRWSTTLHADYIAMAPGGKTPRRMNTDTREWSAVQDGQIRFSIDGQAPFVASKGYLVQVPYRTFYTMETVGDQSSLRLEVNIAKARKMYPLNTTPVPVPVSNSVLVLPARERTRVEKNRTWTSTLLLQGPIARVSSSTMPAPSRTSSSAVAFRRRPRRTRDTSTRRARSSGSFSSARFATRSRGLPTFVADQGDIVYVPKQRWHLASLAGDGMSARLAMNGYPDLAHSFEAPDPGEASR